MTNNISNNKEPIVKIDNNIYVTLNEKQGAIYDFSKIYDFQEINDPNKEDFNDYVVINTKRDMERILHEERIKKMSEKFVNMIDINMIKEVLKEIIEKDEIPICEL